MLREVLVVIAVLSALPVGYLLAYLCRDELVQGRKWFKLMILISIVIIIGLLLSKINYWLEMVLGLVYLAVVSAISLKLSYKKGFVR